MEQISTTARLAHSTSIAMATCVSDLKDVGFYLQNNKRLKNVTGPHSSDHISLSCDLGFPVVNLRSKKKITDAGNVQRHQVSRA